MKSQIAKKTLYNRRINKRDLAVIKNADVDYPPFRKPKTREECRGGQRPCPFVSCRYHLYLEVTKTGSITFNFDEEPWEISPSCCLDVAEEGAHFLEELGRIFHVCRERIRQIERDALKKLKKNKKVKDWRSAA